MSWDIFKENYRGMDADCLQCGKTFNYIHLAKRLNFRCSRCGWDREWVGYNRGDKKNIPKWRIV